MASSASTIAQALAIQQALTGGGKTVNDTTKGYNTVTGVPYAPAKAASTTSVAAPAETSSGSSSAATAANKSNDIAMQNAGLNAVGQQESSGINSVNANLASIMGQYGTQDAQEAATLNGQTVQNNQNLQAQKEAALQNAVQGKQGLDATLASLGALNGSGVQLADQAVQSGANSDLGDAEDTYTTNAGALAGADAQYQTEAQQRKQDAQNEANNDIQSVKNTAAKNQQTFYSNLANDYAAQNDAGNESKYSQLAASLYPSIGTTSVQSSPISSEAATFNAPTLQSFISGTKDTSVSAGTGADGTPTLVAGDDEDEAKKKQTVAATA